MNKEKIAVIGLGYVGLPVALALAENFETIGFDINQTRIAQLKNYQDLTLEISQEELKNSTIKFSFNGEDLQNISMFIITVPTPIDEYRKPDLRPLINASKAIAPYLSKNCVVVYESTVYPGVTEEVCAPILQQFAPNLIYKTDFFVAYSPERINPGDKNHRLANILKIVSGDTPETLARVAAVYGKIIKAGLHLASCIKVAEAAKVIENTQRDVNIALVNELAMIFDKLNIRTDEVLAAAGTKWNFLNFKPGLVGGHCIGVDPYYLTARAEQLGYNPQIILSGRRINDAMGAFIAQKTIKLLIAQNIAVKNAKIGILGFAFKENVPDCRNSKIPDIIAELQSFGCEVIIHDPMVDKAEVKHEYNLNLDDATAIINCDALILGVAHDGFKNWDYANSLKKGGVFIDVKSQYSAQDFPNQAYWSL